MKKWIRKILAGNNVISEYSKITVPGTIREKVHLEVNGLLINVSHLHWLLCIEPVVYGVWIEKEEYREAIGKNTNCKLYFSHPGNEDRDNIPGKVLAVLNLTCLQHIEEKKGTLFLLREEKSRVRHLNFIKRYLLFHRYYRKNGLTFQRFKSFVAAYSYPRRIRVISFRQDDYYNIFPMDLLGDISTSNRYVFGLRHSNVALAKIIETGRLVVSEVPFEQKDSIYQLGSHHSSSPPPLDSLPFKVVHSKNYGFYIPGWAVSYKEIRILQTINMGSHMLLWGKSSDAQVLQEPDGHIHLIHFLHYLYQKDKEGAYPLV